MSLNASEAVRISERGDTGVITMASTAAVQSLYKAFVAVSAVTKTGTGTTTVTASGAGYNNAQKRNLSFIVEVTTAAATDKFKWSDDGGNTWKENVSVTGSAQTLSDGVTITFSATTGGVVGDRHVFTVTLPRNIKAVHMANSVSGNGTYYWGFRSTITANTDATAGHPLAEGESVAVEIDDLSKVFVLGGNSKVLHVAWIG